MSSAPQLGQVMSAAPSNTMAIAPQNGHGLPSSISSDFITPPWYTNYGTHTL
jgi:hypothetical protein